MCRNDVQKNFDAAVVEVAGHQATVTQAEKKFVIKMRSIILKDKKLVRKIDFHKVCHKSLNKAVEKFVELKGEESRRFNRWGPSPFGGKGRGGGKGGACSHRLGC